MVTSSLQLQSVQKGVRREPAVRRHTLQLFAESNAPLKSSVILRFKRRKQKQTTKSKVKKYLLYQTGVMGRIIMMLSEQEPELHYKCEIFYEDQMETLNV